MYLGSLEKLDNDGFYKCSKIGIKTIIESGADRVLEISSYFEKSCCRSAISFYEIEKGEMELRDRISMILLEHYKKLIR